jgi:hypothetical protein
VDVFLYPFKYLFKGVDYTKFHIAEDHEMDAIDQYIRGRYLSAPEAAWRILAYDICQQHPSVSCLKIHESNGNRFQYSFSGHTRGGTPSQASDLIRYFNRPLHPMFDEIRFINYYQLFVLHPIPVVFPSEYWSEATTLPDVPARIIVHRKQPGISQLQSVRPGMGEVFYI